MWEYRARLIRSGPALACPFSSGWPGHRALGAAAPSMRPGESGCSARTAHPPCPRRFGHVRGRDPALLLQSLHPLAMAAVAGHSGYRGDPWGRLQRTSYFLAVTTFGRDIDAEAAIDRVRSIHQRVTGTAPDGRRYAAADPHLLTWVHIAEADSFLRAYRGSVRAPSRRPSETAMLPTSR